MSRSENTLESSSPVTPLPQFKVLILGLILYANNSSIWMIFSFLPFMVQHYFPDLSVAELGYYAGMLGSAFSGGALAGNIIWGVVSDRYGRRPALLCGLLGTAVSSLCFGFAPNFWSAVFARFMWGLLNGNIGVAKTYLGEVCDDSNLAKGMALFGVIGGFGRSIGPVIGGFLSSPAKAYPTLFKGTIFDTFPFALPSLVICINCIIVLVISYYSLHETLHSTNGTERTGRSDLSGSKKYTLLRSADDNEGSHEPYEFDNQENNGLELARVQRVQKAVVLDDNVDGSDESNRLMSKNNYDDCAEFHDVQFESQSNDSVNKQDISKRRVTFSGLVSFKVIGSDELAYGPMKGIKESETPVDCDVSAVNKDVEIGSSTQKILRYSNGAEDFDDNYDKRSFYTIVSGALRQKAVLISTLLYGFNAMATIIFNEIFPLWIVTPITTGGFHYTSYKIGVATMICGVIGIILQVTLYPALTDRYGVLRVYKFGVLVFSLTVVLVPSISIVNGFNSELLKWVVVILFLLLANLSSTWVLVTVFVFINNSCYNYQRATVNGIGQTFASLGRLCGPYLGATLFAWSETNNLDWPLNYYFVFYLLGIFGIWNWYLSLFLPRNIHRRKREAFVSSSSQEIATRALRRLQRRQRQEEEYEIEELNSSQDTGAGVGIGFRNSTN